MSIAIKSVVWVSIHYDRETVLAWLDFAMKSRFESLPAGSVSGNHYEGGYDVKHEAAIREWFAVQAV